MLKTFITAAAGAVLLAAAPVAAEAAPILYNVEFDGAVAGDPGTGSFLYDADTGTMTDFTWDFGSGRTGGVLDGILAVDLGGHIGGAVPVRDNDGHAITRNHRQLPYIVLGKSRRAVPRYVGRILLGIQK